MSDYYWSCPICGDCIHWEDGEYNEDFDDSVCGLCDEWLHNTPDWRRELGVAD